jgi:uncharacterized membrane protein YccF (DUF307 family)
MRTLGNILWHIPCLGFLNAIAAFLLGALLTLLVIPAPIGLGLIQYAKFLMAPFSHAMVSGSDINPNPNPVWAAYSFIISILYLPFGCILAMVTIAQIIVLACTIAGIPVALVLAKSLRTYLSPAGMVCVPVSVRDAVERQKGDEYLGNLRR